MRGLALALSDLIHSILDWFRPPRPAPKPPAPTPTPTPSPTPIPDADLKSYMVAALNAQRGLAGLPGFVTDSGLDDEAQEWAKHLAVTGVLTHGDWTGRIEGVHPGTAAGEDIAAGYPSVDAVVAGWMDSPGHRANILGDFDRIGVGRALGHNDYAYWVVDFDKLL